MAKALDIDYRKIFVPTKGSSVTQNEVDQAKILFEKGLKVLNGVVE